MAGDISGVEEASTAMEEGKLAGANAAAALGYLSAEQGAKRSDEIWESLNSLRCGVFGEKRRKAKDKLLSAAKELVV